MSVVARDELWRLYEIHVQEYHFQIQLNNRRFQWYTALDVALITVGTGLLRVGSGGDNGLLLTSLVFVVGALLAGFTAIATSRQVDYQHTARSQALKVADQLGVTDLAVATTPGWRGVPNVRWTKVRTMNYTLLAVLATVNVTGFVYAVAKWVVD